MSEPAVQGSGTLADGAEVAICGPLHSLGNNRIYALAGATGSFRLDLQISIDEGATWVTCKSIADSSNVDGTYDQAAEMDQTAPEFFKLVIHNDSGGSIDYLYDARCYNNIQH